MRYVLCLLWGLSGLGYAQSPEQFNTDTQLAIQYFNKQLYREAIPHFESAFVYTEKLKMQNKNVAEYRRRLAECYESTLNLTGAERQYQLALQEIENDKNFGKNTLEYAEMLRRFGNFYLRNTQIAKANARLDEAIALYRGLGNKSFLYALALRQRARGAWGQKDAAKALANMQEALKIVEAIAPLDTLHQEVFDRDLQAFRNKQWKPEAADYYGKKADDKDAKVRIKKALGFFRLGKFAEASIYFDEYLYAIVQLFGQQEGDLSSTINVMKLSYDYAADLDKLNALEAKVAEIKAKIDKEKALSDKVYTELLAAQVAYTAGNYQKAIPIFENILPDCKVYFKGENPDYAVILNMLGLSYYQQGLYTQAEKPLAEARSIWKNAPAHALDYAGAVKSLALVYTEQGRYALAEQLLKESLELYQKNDDKEKRGYRAALSSLGTVYQATDRLLQAEKAFEECKEIARRNLGKESEAYASALSNLAYLQTAQGAYMLAEQYFEECISIREKLLGREHPEYAQSLYNLGFLYDNMGFYKEAEALYLQARQILEQKLGKLHPKHIEVMSALAQLYNNTGQIEKSLNYYEATLQLYTQTENHLYDKKFAVFCNNLGFVYLYSKRFADSQSFFDFAKKVYKNIFGINSSDYAGILNSEGVLLLSQHRYPEAEAKLKESIGILEKLGDKNSTTYWSTQENLAECYTQQGSFAKAEALYKVLLAQKYHFLDNVFPALSEQEKEAFYENSKEFFMHLQNFFVLYYPQKNAIAAELYNLQLATKAVLFSESNGIRERILRSPDQNLKQLYASWQEKRNYLNKVYQMPEEDKQKTGINEKALEEEIKQIERTLSQKSEAFAAQNLKKRPTWQEVQKQLRPNEASVEIVRTLLLRKDRIDTVYVALIVKSTTQKQPELLLLPNGHALETSEIAYFNNSIRARRKDTRSYQAFWKPIKDKLPGITKVYFSADGVYNKLSMQALYNPETGKYLIDELKMQLLSNSKDLLLAAKATSKVPYQESAFFGFPDYNLNFKESKEVGTQKNSNLQEIALQNERFLQGGNITPLPGTKVEVENIAQVFSDRKLAFRQYLEAAASEENLKNIHSPSILHIATHGFFMKDPESNLNRSKKNQNPLFRSGLLLAGAKNVFVNKYNAQGEDGILTAYEAMALDLQNTELVVASACETGLGEVRNGEGVYGLQRAFRIAGAKNVLMSLWKVDDQATQELMTAFYKAWASSGSISQALEEAQAHVKAKYPEPYYWAAFVMMGER